MKTVTEKYHAVNEGAMSKAEFVRQMRLAHPQFISQFNGFNDSVQILKNKGLLFEKKEEAEYENPSYNLSPDAVRRGLRYELELAGLDPAGDISEDDYMKAHKKAEENIKKDQLHYYRMITHGETQVEHDKMKETKRGAQETDTDNAMAKVKLNENAAAAAPSPNPSEGPRRSTLKSVMRGLKNLGKFIEKDPELLKTVNSFKKDAGLENFEEDKQKRKRLLQAVDSIAAEELPTDPEIVNAIKTHGKEFKELNEGKYLHGFGKAMKKIATGLAFLGGLAAIFGSAAAFPPSAFFSNALIAFLIGHGAQIASKRDDDDVKEETTESLTGDQHKLDVNKNGKIDASDFASLRKGVNEAEEKIKRALKKRIVKILKEGHEETLHMDVPQIEEPEHSHSSKLSSMVEDNQYSTEERKTLLKLDNLVNTVTGDTLSYQEQLRSTLSEFPADSQILDDALEAFKSDVNARFESAFSNMDSSKEEVKSEKEVEAMQQEQERLQQEMEKEAKKTVFNENKKTK